MESISALLAPSVIAIFFLLGNFEFTILHNLATILTGSACFILPSFSFSNNTSLPSYISFDIKSEVTGSSNRSLCIDGTNSIGVLLPLAEESAIIIGESIIP